MNEYPYSKNHNLSIQTICIKTIFKFHNLFISNLTKLITHLKVGKMSFLIDLPIDVRTIKNRRIAYASMNIRHAYFF